MVGTRRQPLPEVVIPLPARIRRGPRARSTNNVSRTPPPRAEPQDSDSSDSDAQVADLLLTPNRTQALRSSPPPSRRLDRHALAPAPTDDDDEQGDSPSSSQPEDVAQTSDLKATPNAQARPAPRCSTLTSQSPVPLASASRYRFRPGLEPPTPSPTQTRTVHRQDDDNDAREEHEESHTDPMERGISRSTPTVGAKGKGKRTEKGKRKPVVVHREDDDADVEDGATNDRDDGDDQGNETDYDVPSATAATELQTRKRSAKSNKSTQDKGKGRASRRDESFRGASEEQQSFDEDDSGGASRDEVEPVPTLKKRTRAKPTRSRTRGRSPDEDDAQPHKRKKKSRAKIYKPNSADEEEDDIDRVATTTNERQDTLDFSQHQPGQDPDRCRNPDRLESFTHWCDGEFVPDRIWLHDDASSWRFDDELGAGGVIGRGSERLVPREEVVKLVVANGGTVYGPKRSDIKRCNIVVVPDWTSPGYDKTWTIAYNRDAMIVNRKWIFESILLQEDGRDPGYRCNPLQSEYTPRCVGTARVFAPAPFEKRRVIRQNETGPTGVDRRVEVVYRVREEEEQYWMVLARKCETGPRSGRISKVEMFRKLERKFGATYRRSYDDYSALYELFKDKMLALKKMRRPNPDKGDLAQRRILRDMKLFSTDDEEEEEEEEVEAEAEFADENGNDEADGFAKVDDVFSESRGPVNFTEENSNPFRKRKSKAQLEREAHEAEEDELRAASLEGEQLAEEDNVESDSVESDVDLASLAQEYSRTVDQIQGIWWYSNLSLRRTRTALDVLDRARQVPKSDYAEIGRFVTRATKHLFSEQQDALLRHIAQAGFDVEARREHPIWQALKDRGWSERQLDARLGMLEWMEEDVNAVDEVEAGDKLVYWYPTLNDL